MCKGIGTGEHRRVELLHKEVGTFKVHSPLEEVPGLVKGDKVKLLAQVNARSFARESWQMSLA